MANPYHDSNGRFCSRDGMLKDIHRLASNGQVTEYLALKTEFDEIDKTHSVVLTTESFNSILEKAHLTSADVLEPKPKENYSGLEDYELSDKFADADWRVVDGDESARQEMYDILEASKYSQELVYTALHSESLTYEDKADLLKKHAKENPYLYQFLVQDYQEESMTKNKQEITEAIDSIHTKSSLEPQDVSALGKMITVMAGYTESEQELENLVNKFPFGQPNGGISTSALVESKHLTKDIAVQVLEKDIASGSDDYWNVRKSLAKTLTAKGFIVKDHSWKEIHELKATPLTEAPSQEEISRLRTAENDFNYFSAQNYKYDLEEKLKFARATIDAYEPNYKELRKQADANNTATEWVNLRNRIAEAESYMRKRNDYEEFVALVKRLKF